MFEGIYFANPNYLWLLLILPVVLTWQIISRNKIQPLLKMPSLSNFQEGSFFWTRIFKRIDLTSRTLISLIEPKF